MGRPPEPLERLRKRGTWRADRHSPRLALLDPVSGPPDPPRPLGPAGRRLWNQLWSAGGTWLAESDTELALLTAETMDERVALRLRVVAGAGWRERVALRQLDVVLVQQLALLGFTPTSRSRLGVAEVWRSSALEGLLGQLDDDA